VTGSTATVHEKRIPIRWRDMDALAHVNNAVYLNYLEEVRDEWLIRILGPGADPFNFVIARVAIDFRRQLRKDDGVVVATCTLAGVGRSSIQTREVLRTPADAVVAEASSVLVSWNRQTDATRPLAAAERAALERDLAPKA